MVGEEYQEPNEVAHFNPFAKQIKHLHRTVGGIQTNPTTSELLGLIEEMADYIGKLEAKISRINNSRDDLWNA